MKKLVTLLALLGIAAGGYYVYRQVTPRAPLHEKQLTFAAVSKTTMRDLVSATGIVHLPDILVVGPEMPGQLQSLHAQVNDLVIPGTLLAKLDDRRAQLTVEEARNQVKTAEAAVEQARSVKEAAEKGLQTQIDLEKQGGFRSERDQADAQAKAAKAGLAVALAKLESAQTGLKQALLFLEQLEIRVPVLSTGSDQKFLVLERKAQQGQMVGPQSGPLFTLAGDLRVVEIHAQVAEGDIAKVRKGLGAVFTVTTFSDEEKEFVGKVKQIQPLGANLKGAVYYDTIIEVINEKDPTTGEWRLRPGMTVSLDILRREHQDVWRAPSMALNFKLDEAYQNESAKKRIADWKKRPDADLWYTLWLWDEVKQSARPAFVRIGGVGADGQPGMKDSEGNEVLEWEPGAEPKEPLRVIIGAPPAKAPGIFDQPANLKVAQRGGAECRT